MSSGDNGRTAETSRVLAGRYRVVSRLGRGGMGVVWRAVDERLGREVAVKELRAYTDADGPELANLRLRMQREARAAARVRHPGVIAVHDVAEVDGRPLIVMELVDGPSLDDVLRERGTLDPREAAGIGVKVMDALAAAHGAGVLHRDVKPGNILLERTGRVVLTDFGIASMDDPGDGSTTHLTRSGELVGSLDYLAPERAQGADPGPASDVWALGATLYAAVEGTSPFRRTSAFTTLTAIVADPVPDSHRAGPLGPVLERLLEKRPGDRPDADEARDLLRAVAEGRDGDVPTTALRATGPRSAGAQAPPGDTAEEPTPAEPAAAPRRRRRGLLTALVAAVFLAAAGATVAVLHYGGDGTQAEAGPTPTATGSGGADTAEPTERDSTTPTPTPTPTPSPTGTPGSGSGQTASTAACDPIGGGKYNCQVTRTADSYTADGAKAGVLKTGTSYFYCQQNLGRRETYGEWTNVWWAKTDDDSGNRDVFVSAVYIRGGDNDEPVPGLPVC
ncbi:serine/threonine-protein kinase [Streptomyces sp. NPDC090106]|uniref:serine/threonine-protein kinase n=1 Tax=Streptomyces sp. NPDC090106 TaxID=3365946 RepID=UPI00381BE109